MLNRGFRPGLSGRVNGGYSFDGGGGGGGAGAEGGSGVEGTGIGAGGGGGSGYADTGKVTVLTQNLVSIKVIRILKLVCMILMHQYLILLLGILQTS